MSRTPPHLLPPERKVRPVLAALEKAYGRPRRRRRDPLEVLVRGILSQNTNDTNSGRAYEELRRRFPTWQALAAAPAPAIADAIRLCGLAEQKSRAIRTVLDWLNGHGDWSLDFLKELPPPEAERALASLHGVGIKTARLVLLFGFGWPVFVVDTHIWRLSRRLALVPQRCSREKAHHLLDGLIPDRDKYSAHLNMIAHGRQVCHARSPECGACVLRLWCPSGEVA